MFNFLAQRYGPMHSLVSKHVIYFDIEKAFCTTDNLKVFYLVLFKSKET